MAKKRVYTESEKKMKGKILSCFEAMGWHTPEKKLDFERVDYFIKNIGSNNPKQKPLNFLYEKELLAVLTQVEQMYKSINNF